MAPVDITLYRPSYSSVRLINCSPPSWMVEIALREKAVPFAVRELSFAAGEHKTPAMLALNPRGTIPVLTVDEAVLWESLAMLEHIDDAFPAPPLLGTDGPGRARARNRLHESAALKQRGMALFAYFMRTPTDQRDRTTVNDMRAAFMDELDRWRGYYDESPWAAGPAMTLADISVYTYLATACRLGLSLTGSLTSLAGFARRMAGRPSVTTGWPWSRPADETPLADGR